MIEKADKVSAILNKQAVGYLHVMNEQYVKIIQHNT
jgi:hypothetical protein